MNDGVDSSREEDPFVSCQILERDEFLLSGCVGLRESRIEMGLSECFGCDLKIVWRHLSDHPKPATDYHLKTGQRE